jgi:hypothetical protein
MTEKRSIKESTALSYDVDNSSQDEWSDDDYDTDEEADLSDCVLSPKKSNIPLVQDEIRSAVTLGKSQFIHTVVSEFLQSRFWPAPGITSLAGSEQTKSSGATGSSSGGAKSESHGNGGGRKRGQENTPPSEQSPSKGHQDGNGDDPNKRRKLSHRKQSADFKKGKRYACPYYQRDPKSHSNKRSCIGPGWTEVHRVK